MLEQNNAIIGKWYRCFCSNNLAENLEAFDLYDEGFNQAGITYNKVVGWEKETSTLEITNSLKQLLQAGTLFEVHSEKLQNTLISVKSNKDMFLKKGHDCFKETLCFVLQY